MFHKKLGADNNSEFTAEAPQSAEVSRRVARALLSSYLCVSSALWGASAVNSELFSRV